MAVTRVQYNYLGSSGIKVSNMCFGGNLFSKDTSQLSQRQQRPGCPDEEESYRLLDRFAEMGGNFIDTADIYTKGQSESIIGSWATRHGRQKVIIATKCRFGPPGDPNNTGLSRKHIMDAIDGSLSRLGTDHIDLYQIHGWDRGTPIEETMTALNDLVSMGKVHYIGASNVKGWQLQKMAAVSRERRLAHITTLQAQYNLMVRGVELELTDVCESEGIGIIAWSPLKGGWLSGKIKKGMETPPEGSRVAWASEDPNGRGIPSNPPWQKWACEKTWDIIDRVESVSKDIGKSMAQVSLRWVLQKESVSSVIFGAKNLQQLEENIEAASGWRLSEENMAALDDISKLTEFYPYDMVRRHQLLR